MTDEEREPSGWMRVRNPHTHISTVHVPLYACRYCYALTSEIALHERLCTNNSLRWTQDDQDLTREHFAAIEEQQS